MFCLNKKADLLINYGTKMTRSKWYNDIKLAEVTREQGCQIETSLNLKVTAVEASGIYQPMTAPRGVLEPCGSPRLPMRAWRGISLHC